MRINDKRTWLSSIRPKIRKPAWLDQLLQDRPENEIIKMGTGDKHQKQSNDKTRQHRNESKVEKIEGTLTDYCAAMSDSQIVLQIPGMDLPTPNHIHQWSNCTKLTTCQLTDHERDTISREYCLTNRNTDAMRQRSAVQVPKYCRRVGIDSI